MKRESRPWKRGGVPVGGLVAVLGIALSGGGARAAVADHVKTINQFITSPAVTVSPGQVFTFRVTCQGTYNKTPCQTKTRINDRDGVLVKQFNEPIAAGKTKDFSVLNGSQVPTVMWVSAKVEWRAVREGHSDVAEAEHQEDHDNDDCCCNPEASNNEDDCDSQPTMIEVRDPLTGKLEAFTVLSKCVRAIRKGGGT